MSGIDLLYLHSNFDYVYLYSAHVKIFYKYSSSVVFPLFGAPYVQTVFLFFSVFLINFSQIS